MKYTAVNCLVMRHLMRWLAKLSAGPWYTATCATLNANVASALTVRAADAEDCITHNYTRPQLTYHLIAWESLNGLQGAFIRLARLAVWTRATL